MSFSTILTLIFTALGTYETAVQELATGSGSVNSPALQVGTDQGKPVYGYMVFSNTRPTT